MNKGSDILLSSLHLSVFLFVAIVKVFFVFLVSCLVILASPPPPPPPLSLILVELSGKKGGGGGRRFESHFLNFVVFPSGIGYVLCSPFLYFWHLKAVFLVCFFFLSSNPSVPSFFLKHCSSTHAVLAITASTTRIKSNNNIFHRGHIFSLRYAKRFHPGEGTRNPTQI